MPTRPRHIVVVTFDGVARCKSSRQLASSTPFIALRSAIASPLCPVAGGR
jgi:hypothetical protein